MFNLNQLCFCSHTFQRVRTARPAAAVLPAGCSARQARLPACRPVRGAGLHRRQAHHGGPARQYLAVHQRRRRRPLGAGGAHMAVAGCDCARNWRRIRGFRDQDEEHGYQSFEVFERCTITLPGISITDIVIVILNYFIDGMAVFYIHLTGTITFIQKIKDIGHFSIMFPI